MKAMYPIATIMLVSFLVSSCTSSTILKARFNDLSLGTTPPHDLAGAPTGDRLDYISELAPGLKVREWETPGTKSLEFSNVNTGSISGHDTWLNFRGISSNLAETVWFVYNAKLTGSDAEIITDLTDGSGSPIARMKINSAGQVRLVRGDYTTENLIGTIPVGARHNVIFVVSGASASYNLLIASPGHELIRLDNQPTFTTNALNFHNPCNPTISFNFSSGSASASKYAIADVTISRKNP